MEPLDSDLRWALRRREAPPEMTAGVMAAVRAEPRPRRRSQRNWVLVGTVAACLVVGLFVRKSVRSPEALPAAGPSISAQQAEKDLLMALRIAGEKVQKARLAVIGGASGGSQ